MTNGIILSRMYPKSLLPNQEGYKFTAVLNDGTEKEDVVVKNQDPTKGYVGMHTCQTFGEMRGWKSLK